MEYLSIDPRTVDLDAMIDRGVQLHGHEGPFLIAGIRMGLLALDLLHSPGYLGIEAESDAGSTPPLSCLSDGIQIGSGCTVGKGNLRVTTACRPAARFVDARGRTLQVELRPDILDAFLTGSAEETSTLARHAPLCDLFLWNWAEPSA